MSVVSLLQHMLQSNPKERASIKDIKKHPWTRGETISARQLVPVLKERHRLAEQKRLKDVRKMSDLAVSVNKNRAVEGLEAKSRVEDLPETEIEAGFHLYTWGNWVSIYDQMHDFIPSFAQGQAEYKWDTHRLDCQISVAQNAAPVRFFVKLYKSRVWAGKAPEDAIDASNVPEKKKLHKDKVYIVKLVLVSGEVHTWKQFKNGFLLTKCANAFKGLPKWAQKIAKAEVEAETAAQGKSMDIDEQKDEDSADENTNSNANKKAEVDDYDNLLTGADIWGKSVASGQSSAAQVVAQ